MRAWLHDRRCDRSGGVDARQRVPILPAERQHERVERIRRRHAMHDRGPERNLLEWIMHRRRDVRSLHDQRAMRAGLPVHGLVELLRCRIGLLLRLAVGVPLSLRLCRKDVVLPHERPFAVLSAAPSGGWSSGSSSLTSTRTSWIIGLVDKPLAPSSRYGCTGCSVGRRAGGGPDRRRASGLNGWTV